MLFVFSLLSVFVLVYTVAQAAPLALSTAGATNLARPCSHLGVTGKVVAVSGTSARTVGALTTGSGVMVTCKMNAFLDFGLVDNTAVADGTDHFVLGNVPYWFAVESGGQYIAMIKESGATDGNCYVSECR